MKSLALALTLTMCLAMPATSFAAPGRRVTVQIKNDVPTFERFYREASQPGVSEAQRWALWQKDYGIAAVPPTPEGQALARKQLDEVWPRYKQIMPRLPELTAHAIADSSVVAEHIARELVPVGKSVHIVLMLYVGQFDENAFSIPAMHGRPPETIMPVESRNMLLLLAHELSHDVNFALADVKNSFGAPLGQTIFVEGLAMRSASRSFPGYPDAAYTEMPGDKGWLQNCLKEKKRVLLGVRDLLDDSGPAVTSRFTFGTGTTGMRREAYCAAWIVFGALLTHESLSQLATVHEDQMIDLVRKGIDTSLII